MSSPVSLIDTRIVPPGERSEYWSAGIATHFFPVRLATVQSGAFEARLIGGEAGPITIGAIGGLPHRVVRTSALVAERDPECVLVYLVLHGQVRLEQANRECTLAPGDIACHDTSRPSAFESTEAFEVLLFGMPKWLFGGRAERIARRSATRTSGGGGRLARVATPFLVNLARASIDGPGLSGGDGDTAAEMLLPLMNRIFDDDALPASPPADLLGSMRRFAIEHLDDPGLGPERIANAHFVSTRYVHKLFATEGTGVSEWIRERRLAGAESELRATPGMPISQVAERWGYRNPASFSRAFRSRYGLTPRELRG